MHARRHLLEQSSQAAGLAGSVLDDRGFLWDYGGHVIFSHYDYYDAVMLKCTPKPEWNERVRAAYVWMRDRFVPYPLQLNVWMLPEDDTVACLDGLLEIHNRVPAARAANFDEWILQKFGRGLADVFMRPYNRKVWAIDPTRMCTEWMGERVAQVDLRPVLRSMVQRKESASWGPNAVFRYPKQGGTGGLWLRVAAALPQHRFAYGSTVAAIHLRERRVTMTDGRRVHYKSALVTTLPIDVLLRAIEDLPVELAGIAERMRFSSVHVLGFGVDSAVPAHLADKSWLYFPEDDTPAFRVTVFSNYADSHVPCPGRQYSLMCEVSQSTDKPVDEEHIVQLMEDGLRATKLIARDAPIVSRFHVKLHHGYPTPFLGRDELVDKVDTVLRRHGVYSRGRFGAWKYEVSNQDHSFMQGVESADAIVNGRDELTFFNPDLVNGQKRTR